MKPKILLGAITGALCACGAGPAGAPQTGPDFGDANLPYVDGGTLNVGWPTVDGGYVLGEAGTFANDRFITKLVSVTYGPCAGFGQANLPNVIEGPPIGGGSLEGSLDVLSLGNGGSIVVAFEPNAIIDGPGADFIVFENPFWYGDPQRVYAEPGQVSVSDDGVAWAPFPCTATNASGPPYGMCGGWSPVLSSPSNGISPFDSTSAGGNAFDLHEIGVAHARFIRIVDQGGEPCPASGEGPITNGFDLDAISIVNAEIP